MNDLRIKEYVDGIFNGVKMTDKVMEQKEELIVNITERVRDYMKDGLSFDAAFETAKNLLGDTDELTAPFEKSHPNGPTPAPEPDKPHSRVTPSFQTWALPALSPFIYLGMGFLFGWWAWGWVVIPVSGIVGTPMPFWTKCVALSPFAYVLLGFMFGWWAWAWIIIPVSGIMTQAIKRS